MNMNRKEKKRHGKTANVLTKKVNVLFLRHGVARHNLPIGRRKKDQSNMYEYVWPDLKDPIYTDTSLVPDGFIQAKGAGERLYHHLFKNDQGLQQMKTSITKDAVVTASKTTTSSSGSTNNAQEQQHQQLLNLVLSSPLTRCIQTSTTVLDSFCNLAHTTNITKKIDILCHQDLREAYGKHYSDKRSTKSSLIETWPSIQFDPKMTEEDEDWDPNHREGIDHIIQRINNVFYWLLKNCLHNAFTQNQNSNRNTDKNTEKESGIMTDTIPTVLLVTHGVWVETCFMTYCPQVLDGGRSRVHNCNLFAGTLVGTWEEEEEQHTGTDDMEIDDNSGSSKKDTKKWKCVKMRLRDVQFLG